ncbi:hypothetical protein DCAR_0314386 [Daucus carota subsp. sativus]|uniref:Uncharacterized protein n=1 Tax=Daucus carota subsp. sativus TaxID=79200 RepID=A0A161Y3X4_DAUCS|nr:PREDICTED: prothymosin alpha-like [Daucus carota subsp. sativus]WOG95084.1 hypothetical protein DCAR_0314386 [Daucus carota subsp. sativus]
MASLQVASPQAEEVSSDAEEQTVMTPPAQNFDIEKTVHVIDDDDIEQVEDDDDIEIIPRRDEGKQVEDLEDATDEEEEDIVGGKPAAQFDDDDDEDYEEPAGKGIRSRRFPDEDEDEE